MKHGRLQFESMREFKHFPDDWTFEGSLSAQYKQIGNAVPVNLAFHIGEAIVKALNSQFQEINYPNLEELTPYQLQLLESSQQIYLPSD